MHLRLIYLLLSPRSFWGNEAVCLSLISGEKLEGFMKQGPGTVLSILYKPFNVDRMTDSLAVTSQFQEAPSRIVDRHVKKTSIPFLPFFSFIPIFLSICWSLLIRSSTVYPNNKLFTLFLRLNNQICSP